MKKTAPTPKPAPFEGMSIGLGFAGLIILLTLPLAAIPGIGSFLAILGGVAAGIVTLRGLFAKTGSCSTCGASAVVYPSKSETVTCGKCAQTEWKEQVAAMKQKAQEQKKK